MAKTMKTDKKSVFLREGDIESKGYFRVELKERFYDSNTSGEYIADFDDSTGLLIGTYKKIQDMNLFDDKSGREIFKYVKVDNEQVLRIIRSNLHRHLVDTVPTVVSLEDIAEENGITLKILGQPNYFNKQYRQDDAFLRDVK